MHKVDKVTHELSTMTNLPTLYEHYTTPNITEGLIANTQNFTLNNKDITLYSGALHYFRVHPKYWRDRLRKLKACGLNTVETYVPWNLHESEPGKYDFGKGGTDFEEYLDIEKFITIAKEEDLFVIVRPGPYICSEWEFGGMPSWLLRHDNIKVRTSDEVFMNYVTSYFNVLLKMLSVFQFIKGGPIIAFQIENEYGNVKVENEEVDLKYLLGLKDLFIKNGIVELLFTSDTPSNGFSGAIPGTLYTANFQNDTVKELDLLKAFQPDRPFMVMEFWTGWFDHWGENHHLVPESQYSEELENILKYPSSFNLYMFHGGTNWGFMNGANLLEVNGENSDLTFDTSSYDYDAPLTESGDYTDKYLSTQKLISKYNAHPTRLPAMPIEAKKVEYKQLNLKNTMSLEEAIKNGPLPEQHKKLIAMELLDVNNGTGQSYGYILYRKENLDIPANAVIKIGGQVCDTAMLLINGELKSKILESTADFSAFGYWLAKDATLNLGPKAYENATLDIVVENWGRNNFGKLRHFNQKKGIWQGDISINEEILENWKIYPLEFKKSFIGNLPTWSSKIDTSVGPRLYKFELKIEDEPEDTFIDMRDWVKGIVVVNQFVLSRYSRIGPQQTVYLPAPLLKRGINEIIVFEHFQPSQHLKFSTEPIFDNLKKSIN